MTNLIIEHVEVFACTPPVLGSTWTPEQPEPCTTHTFIRITTRDGVVGSAATDAYTSHHRDAVLAETLRAKMLADTYLTDVVQVNGVRNMLAQRVAGHQHGVCKGAGFGVDMHSGHDQLPRAGVSRRKDRPWEHGGSLKKSARVWPKSAKLSRSPRLPGLMPAPQASTGMCSRV